MKPCSSNRSRLRKNSSEWFDKHSTNGKCSIISNSPPLAPSVNSGQTLRLSKGERWVFQQPARYSFFRPAVLHLSGIFLLAVTLCVAFPFFLVIVTLGTASTGAFALGSRWDERRGKLHGAHERERFSPRAKRTRDHNSSVMARDK